MRTHRIVIAIAVLLMPVAVSQAQQGEADAATGSPTLATEAPALSGTAAREPSKTEERATPRNRSMMGLVMDVLIESAEQSAQQQRMDRLTAIDRNAPSSTPPVTKPAPGKQVAVESEP